MGIVSVITPLINYLAAILICFFLHMFSQYLFKNHVEESNNITGTILGDRGLG